MTEYVNKTVLRPPIKLGIEFVLLAFGIGIRCFNYLKNQSFWLDEAYTAFQIVNRTWSDIFHFIAILPDQPKPPLLFVCINKISVFLFGNHEMALRLFPLLASVLSLILFYFYVRKHFPPLVQMIAVMYMSLSSYLIYYSGELKPYSSDVLVTLVLFWVFDRMRHSEYNKKVQVLFGAISTFCLWLSNATLFIYPPLAVYVFIQLIKRLNAKEMLVCLLVNMMWFFNFFILYINVFKTMVSNDYIVDMYRNLHAFPLSHEIGELCVWVAQSQLNMMQDPAGFGFPVLAFVLFLWGGCLLYRNDKTLLYVFLAPLGLLVIMAIFQKYPYWRRLILFISPVVYIMVSLALGHLLTMKKKIYFFIGVLAFFFISAQFYMKCWEAVVHPRQKTENRQALSYLSNHILPHDIILLNQSAQYPLMYYINSLNLDSKLQKHRHGNQDGGFYLNNMIRMNDVLSSHQGQPLMWGRQEYYIFGEDGYLKKTIHRAQQKELFKIDFDNIKHQKGKRIWLFLSHYHQDVKDFLLAVFNSGAKCILSYEGEDAAVYLYSF